MITTMINTTMDDIPQGKTAEDRFYEFDEEGNNQSNSMLTYVFDVRTNNFVRNMINEMVTTNNNAYLTPPHSPPTGSHIGDLPFP